MWRSFLISFFFMAFPVWAGAYEDQTKYLLQNDEPMGREEAAAHERSFRREPAVGVSPNSPVADKSSRKLGNTLLDQCIKRKIDKLTKESLIGIDISTPFGRASKELLLKGETTSVEDIDPQLLKDCQLQSPPEKKEDVSCDQYPRSYPESGGCKCKTGYLPSETMHACIRQGLVGQAQKAFDAIGETRILLAEKKKIKQKSTNLGRFFPFLELKDSLPMGIDSQKRRNYNGFVSKIGELLLDVENKLEQAQEKYDSEQYPYASEFALDAKALLVQIDDIHNKSECSLNTNPSVSYNGQRTVLVDLNLPSSGCSCRDQTFSLVKYTYIHKFLFWSNESTQVLKSVPACDVAGPDSILSIDTDFPGIGPGSRSKSSGPILLWRTFTWLVGVLSPKL